jgi:hypothetical protein
MLYPVGRLGEEVREFWGYRMSAFHPKQTFRYPVRSLSELIRNSGIQSSTVLPPI